METKEFILSSEELNPLLRLAHIFFLGRNFESTQKLIALNKKPDHSSIIFWRGGNGHLDGRVGWVAVGRKRPDSIWYQGKHSSVFNAYWDGHRAAEVHAACNDHRYVGRSHDFIQMIEELLRHHLDNHRQQRQYSMEFIRKSPSTFTCRFAMTTEKHLVGN